MYQKIERSWNDVDMRSYKLIINLTGASVNDASGSVDNGLMNEVSAISYRCTRFLVVPFKMTDASNQVFTQQISLNILISNIDSSTFESKNVHWIAIPNIDELITSLVMPINLRSASTSSLVVGKVSCE